MKNNYVRAALLDTISRFKSSANPMGNVIKDMVRLRGLNSHARRLLTANAYDWCRFRYLAIDFLAQEIPKFSQLAEQKKEELVITLIEAPTLVTDQVLLGLRDRYQRYLENLGDRRFLVALGPVIGESLKTLDNPIALAKGLFDKPGVYIAFDARKISFAKVTSELSRLNIAWQESPIFPQLIKVNNLSHDQLFQAFGDDVWVMDAGSQLIAHAIGHKPKERTLDMCSGLGQKLKLLLKDGVDLIANDIDAKRSAKAKKRLFGERVKFINRDATEDFGQTFDWILLDAPCSGTGTIRRHPDIIYRTTESALNKYLLLQKRLLINAIKHLNPGGILVYATCSILPSENNFQVEKNLANNSKMKPVTLVGLVGGKIADQYADLSKNSLSLLPHIHDCDGFFVSAWQKIVD